MFPDHIWHRKMGVLRPPLLWMRKCPSILTRAEMTFLCISLMTHALAPSGQKILALSKAWDEDIPRINVFVLNRFGEWTSYVCEEIFEGDAEEHPSPLEIVEHAQKVAAYENRDKVLEVFREEAF